MLTHRHYCATTLLVFHVIAYMNTCTLLVMVAQVHLHNRARARAESNLNGSIQRLDEARVSHWTATECLLLTSTHSNMLICIADFNLSDGLNLYGIVVKDEQIFWNDVHQNSIFMMSRNNVSDVTQLVAFSTKAKYSMF